MVGPNKKGSENQGRLGVEVASLMAQVRFSRMKIHRQINPIFKRNPRLLDLIEVLTWFFLLMIFSMI